MADQPQQGGAHALEPEAEEEEEVRQDEAEEEEEDEPKRLKVEGKLLESLIVPNPELPTISELQLSTLEQIIRPGKNMYRVKFPVLLDFSHDQFRLKKLDALSNINGKAVEEINLRQNQLHHITQETFLPFTKLRKLRVDDNKLKTVQFGTSCTGLRYLSLTYNKIIAVPQLHLLTNLLFCDLSNNAIKDDFANIFPLTKIRYLYLNNNRLEMTQEEFNDNMLRMKNLKTLQHLRLDNNPFVTKVRRYKEWVLTNVRTLKTLDEQEFAAKQRKKMVLTQPPDSDDEEEEDDEDQKKQEKYEGRIARERLWKMTRELRECQDRPNDVLWALRDVQRSLDEHVKVVDPKYRLLFDDKVAVKESVRPRNIRELRGLGDGNEGDEEEDDERDPREPALLIQEFIMAVDMMMVRQPVVAPKALGLITTMLSISNAGMYLQAREKLEEYLEAGGVYADMVVENLERSVLSRMKDRDIAPDTKVILLETLNVLAAYEPVLEALRNMSTIIAGWLQETNPSFELLGVIATATRDIKIAIELQKQHISRRMIELLHKTHEVEKRAILLQIVGHMADFIPVFAADMARNTVHIELIDEMKVHLGSPGPESDAITAHLVSALNGITKHSPSALADAVSSGFVDHIVDLLKAPNVHPRMVQNCLHAMGGVIAVADQIDAHVDRMGGVVNLLQFIDGDDYDRMCKLVGAVDSDGVPIPLHHQRNRQILDTLAEIVNFFTLFHVRARGDPSKPATISAKKVSDRLDKADREEKLFMLLEVPNDDLRIAVIESLKVVPLDNLQPPEVEHLVKRLASVENLTVGRIEEILGGILDVFTQLVRDPTAIGARFRRNHADTIHIVLSILTRNSARNVDNDREEAVQKQVLSDACVSFLLAASNIEVWPQAVEIMTSRTSVLALGEILRYDEILNRKGKPVLIEKTGCGKSVQSLLLALPSLDMSANVAKRVLIRLAEVLEGRDASSNIDDALIPPPFDYASESKIARKWRLEQHALFVQIGGLDIVLKYLLDNCPIAEDYKAQDVFANYKALRDEEIKEKQERLLGNKGNQEQEAVIPRHRLYHILTVNEELHNPANVKRHVLCVLGEEEEGQDDAQAEERESNALAVAASLRVFQSLLMYGSPATKAKAVRKGRNIEFVRTLVNLSSQITSGRWFPNGVGANLLSILTDLISLQESEAEETEAVIPLYDVAGQVFYKMVDVVDPKLLEILDDATSAQGRTKLRLADQEELLIQKLANAMFTMVVSLQYIRPSDDMEINETIQDNLLMEVIDLKMLRCMVRYLFYDQILAYNVWVPPSQADTNRADTVRSVTKFICEYLHVNDELRFEILELLTRMEVQCHVSLRGSFVAHLLTTVTRSTYLHSLERYMYDKSLFPGAFERILFSEWLECDTLKPRWVEEGVKPKVRGALDSLGFVQRYQLRVPDIKLRLFVVTNAALYVFGPQKGEPCSACDPSKFCPNGPVLLARTTFDCVKRIFCSAGGTRAAVKYTKKNEKDGTTSSRLCLFMTLKSGCLHDLTGLLHRMHPAKEAPSVLPDPVLDVAVKGQLLYEREKNKIRAKELVVEEALAGFIGCHLRVGQLEDGRDRMEPRILVVSSARLYLLREHRAVWLVDMAAENDRLDKEEEEQRLREEQSDYGKKAKVDTNESPEEKAARLQLEKRKRFEQRKVDEKEKREKPKHVSCEAEFPITNIEFVNFNHTTEPSVHLRCTEGNNTKGSGDMLLLFADDPARERFRGLLRGVIKVPDFKAQFNIPGVGASDIKEPSDSFRVGESQAAS